MKWTILQVNDDNTMTVRHRNGMVFDITIDNSGVKPYVIVPILIGDRQLYTELVELCLQVYRLLGQD